MNVLVITGIIPAPISKKLRENNIIIKTEEEFKKRYTNVHFYYLMVIPYSNYFFSFFSKKWREYYLLISNKFFKYEDKSIHVIGIPGIKGDRFLKPIFNLIGFVLNRSKIDELLIKYQIDIVHAHNVHTDAAVAYELFKKCNIPYVITCRGLETNYINYYIKQCIYNSYTVIALNYRQKLILEQLNIESEIIPHGIDDNFPTKELTSNRNNNYFKIVTVSRLLDWKNIDKVLKALCSLNGKIRYDIFGDGPEKERLVNLIIDLGLEDKVFIYGFIPHHLLVKKLPEYDVFILVSFPETFGRVYLEALAAGLPLIASKNSGIDGFIEDGNEGFLVNHLDPSEISEALTKLMNNQHLRNSMRQKTLEKVKFFSWDSVIRKLYNVYNKCNG
ncbi:MAG: glycosyltransferase family 4 protein [Cyclobacterium sp.]|uniref:glycosyltransferase family 4 protein n=1 Tax=Cyclobacterium sp. TaxID=1966343 RepID=UPI003970D78C